VKAKRLIEIRVERRMTQRDVAAGAGMTQTLISRLERGVRVPDTDMKTRLARALHCSVTDLEAPPGQPIGGAAFKGGPAGGCGFAPMMRAYPED
jgi:transcriptional regulator with XRE-family HTH domain